MKYSTSNIRHLASFLIILSLAIFLHYPLHKIESFRPINDWQPLKSTIKRPLHPQIEKNIEDFGILNLKYDWDLGRFLPLWNIIQVTEAFLFSKNPKLWHLETSMIGISTCFLFYIILIRLNFSIIISLISSLWLLFRGLDLWVFKQRHEEPAMLFIMLALFFIVHSARRNEGLKWDWIAISFITMAGFTKETFIFLIPAIVLFRIFLSSNFFYKKSMRKVFQELKVPIAVTIVIFIFQLSIVYSAYRHGPYSQGVIGNLYSFPFPKIATMIKDASQYLSYFIPSLGILFIIPIAFRKKSVFHLCFLVLIILLLWLFPQIFIYKNMHFKGRYIFPAIVGFVILNAVGLQILQRNASKLANILFLLLCVYSFASIVVNYPKTLNLAEFSVARANTYGMAAKKIVHAARDDSNILMICDRPWWGIGISLLVKLSKEKLDCAVFADYPECNLSAKKNIKLQNIGLRLISRYFLPFRPTDASKIDIIVTTYPAEEFLQDISPYYRWFDKEKWNIHICQNKYYKRKLDLANSSNRFLINIHNVEYAVLVRKT